MRVYAPLEDQAVSELDQVAQRKGISRAQLIINSIDSYLHQPEPSTEELDQTRIKLDQANSELDQLRIALDQTRIKLDQSNTEAVNLRDELEQQKTKFNQTAVEETKRWEELKGLRAENTKLKKDQDEARATIQRLQNDVINRQAEIDQAAKVREDLAVAKAAQEKTLESLKVRDEDVAWLRSHVAQLTQQLALPPSEEEAKAKHWYQFWK
jgi:chromosome segregation ATPase